MSQLRITIQLIDVKHGFHISSKNYDVQRPLTLKAQDMLAMDIAKDIMSSLDISNNDIDFRPKEKIFCTESFKIHYRCSVDYKCNSVWYYLLQRRQQ
jgi:hypothetical protein